MILNLDQQNYGVSVALIGDILSTIRRYASESEHVAKGGSLRVLLCATTNELSTLCPLFLFSLLDVYLGYVHLEAF